MILNIIACLAIGQTPTVWAITDKEPPQITFACGAGGIGPGPDEAPPPKKAVCTCGVNCPCKAKPPVQTTTPVVRPTNPVVSRPVAAPVVIRQTGSACYIDANGRKVCPQQR
jgi:hypothetical protein